MNTYKIALSLLIECGVKVYNETPNYLYVINKHGVKDRIDNSENGITYYIFAD